MAKTIADKINKSFDMVREFAPSLLLLRATLSPFEDVIFSETAGPQNGEESEPYFEIMARDGSLSENSFVSFRFTASSNSVHAEQLIEDNDSYTCLDEYETSIASVYDFLRSLPRPAHSFRRRVGK